MSRTVVVCGAAGGIGQAVCQAFAGDGWRVVGIDVHASSGVDLSIEADLRSEEAVDAAFAQIDAAGGVHALVNTAGIQLVRPIQLTTVAEWEDVMGANVRSAFLTIRAATPLLARTKGAIVNVASVHAVATSRGMAAYAASKAALVGLTRGAALDLAELDVRVNAVLPGAVDTGMLRAGISERVGADLDGSLEKLEASTPLGRVGAPREIASVIVFLAGPDSVFITGQVVTADGGVTARLASE